MTIDDVRRLPYQLVHRAASACSTERAPAVVYLQFATDAGQSSNWIRDDLAELRRLVDGHEVFPLGELTVTIRPTDVFTTRLSQLAKGVFVTGVEVLDALLDGPLFDAVDWRYTSI